MDATGSNTVSTYLASAPSNGIAYGATETVEYNGAKVSCVQALLDAQARAKAANVAAADICYKYPKSILSSYFAQNAEHALLSPIMASYLYPDQINLTDSIAYWARKMWHTGASHVQEVVSSTCNDISISTNQSKIGTVEAGYEDRMEEIYNAGNWYYLNNTSEIDAIASGNFKTHDLAALKARTTEPAPAPEPEPTPAAKASSITVNKAKVTASVIASAAKKAGATTASLKKVTLGAKTKTVAAKAFAKYKKVTNLIVKSTKLTKKGVKNSLKGSGVKTVKVPAKKLKAYKKIFTKANCGKKVTVKK